VEHTVTEEITGIDIVQSQIKIAGRLLLPPLLWHVQLLACARAGLARPAAQIARSASSQPWWKQRCRRHPSRR
jgi:biotin carboxylase